MDQQTSLSYVMNISQNSDDRISNAMEVETLINQALGNSPPTATNKPGNSGIAEEIENQIGTQYKQPQGYATSYGEYTQGHEKAMNYSQYGQYNAYWYNPTQHQPHGYATSYGEYTQGHEKAMNYSQYGPYKAYWYNPAQHQPYGYATPYGEYTQGHGNAINYSQYGQYNAYWYNPVQHQPYGYATPYGEHTQRHGNVINYSQCEAPAHQNDRRSDQASTQLFTETNRSVLNSTNTSTAQADSEHEIQSSSDPLAHKKQYNQPHSTPYEEYIQCDGNVMNYSQCGFQSLSANQNEKPSDQATQKTKTIKSALNTASTSTAKIVSGSSREVQPSSYPLVHQTAQNMLDTLPMNICTKRKTGCDIRKMFVKPIDKTAKKLCCPFCEKRFSKLARHIESMHVMEADVQRLLSYPKGSKERRELHNDLRKSGSFNWNMNADLNNNELLTSRRPNGKLQKKASDYKTCPYCKGTYANLRFHVANKCTRKPIIDKEGVKGERFITVLSKTVEARYSAEVNQGLKELFDSMKDDAILRLIKFDWTLIEVGNRLCTKYTNHFDQNMLSNRMRVAGRILSAMKDNNAEVDDFASIFNPILFDSVVNAIKVIGQFNPITKEFKIPGTAGTCVAVVKQFGGILKSLYIRKRDIIKELEVEKFLTLAMTDLPFVISRAITNTKSRMRREKKPNLPTNKDVNLFANYLSAERFVAYEELKTKYSYKEWLKLSEVTMTSIIVFNRRRVGETQNILLKNFIEKETVDEASNGELYASLSEKSKEVAAEYSRMVVRGKLDRTVPVLLSKNVVKCIDLLLNYRERARISKNNPLLFALFTLKPRWNFVRGCVVMKKYANLSGAANPSSLTGTNMRKHMATFCVSLELNDGLVAEVADFMGHHTDTHRNYYRKNPIHRQVQMAQFLEAAQGNREIDRERSDDNEGGSKSHDVGNVKKLRNVGKGTATQSGSILKRKISSAPASKGQFRKRCRDIDGEGSDRQDVGNAKKRRNVEAEGTATQGGSIRKRKISSAPASKGQSRKRCRDIDGEGSDSQDVGNAQKRRNVEAERTATQGGSILKRKISSAPVSKGQFRKSCRDVRTLVMLKSAVLSKKKELRLRVVVFGSLK